MVNNNTIENTVVNEITSKNHLNNDNDQSYLHTTDSHVNSTTSLQSDSTHDGISNANSTSSDVNDLSSNQRIPTATTDHLHHTIRIQLEGTNGVDPLFDTEIIPKPHPPQIDTELDDDESDTNNIPNTPQNHPGIDAGFFPDIDPKKGDDVPDIGPKLGDDDPERPYNPNGNDRKPTFNHFPPEVNPGDGILQSMPDVNVYQHKKTLAQGMMDLALLSANANQLRYVLESYTRHPYYYFSVTFISASIVLQIAVGVGLILNSQYNVKNDEHIHKADRINNFTVLGIFLITIVNVFISSFGVADPPQHMIG